VPIKTVYTSGPSGTPPTNELPGAGSVGQRFSHRRTADLPASLYFVGFTGGVLTLGAVGIIAGPLAIALLVEAVSLLGDAVPDDPAGGS
jgi:hypothetical protein